MDKSDQERSDFFAFKRVRDSGLVNMMEERGARLAGIPLERYDAILLNYDTLSAKYDRQSKK